MRRRVTALGAGALLALTVLLVPGARGQEVASRISGAPDGSVRFEVAARPDVCGNGRSTTVRSGSSGEELRLRGRGWECGILRVAARIRGGEVVGLRARIGGEPPGFGDPVTDLGRVDAPEGGRFLLELVRRGPAEVARRAVFPTAVVDSFVAWPGLLAVARDRERSEEIREKAIFWVGQAAAERVARELEVLASDASDDLDVREKAVFALSQLPAERGVPALVRIVRRNVDPRVTRKALFWLGQSGDPRALALFEEILSGG